MQKDYFIRRNNKDVEYEYTYREDIPHQGSHNLVHNPARGPKPWYSQIVIIGCMDLLVIGWIPKYILTKNSTKVEFTMEKYIIQ
jgi:hypothetical protein